jgi:hypothetical protein
MKQLFFFALMAFPLTVAAQNPIIRDQFTADPTARVFNNKVYLYPSHDIKPPKGQRQDWFCMADYHVFSSTNLTDWTDHGMIVSQEMVPWGNPEGYSMWAPECVTKGGKYYFYFPNGPKSGRGFAIGVATADRPEGPFTLEPEPIKGVSGIDPCVLVDNDGQAYIYWSGMGIRGAKLKANMKELDGELQEVRMPRREGAPEMPPMKVGGEEMKGLPEGFKEGPYAFRRGDWYYLTFPWVRGSKENGANPTETLAYAMSKSPLGPWDFKGIIMAEHANSCWTNHHSIIEYKGRWYLFYHHNDFSPRDDKRRSACIEYISFNNDGTIQEVKPTMRGVGINDATEKIEIDRFSNASSDVTTQLIDTVNTFRSFEATLPAKGSWLCYNDVDFSCISDGYLVINAKASDNTEFCIRENNAKGKVIARFKMTVRPPEPAPGAANNPMMARMRRDLRNQWLTQTAELEYTPKGVTNLVVTNEATGAVSIDWVQFKNRPKYFSPVTTPSAKPDDEGFIRRWMLLEPIDKPNSGNTVFTDSYLREHFNRDYFKGQQTILPKDGQKVTAQFKQEQAPAGFGRGMQQAPAQPEVKTVKQTLTWHALDSENFNVKLFRFAEKWGTKVYGVLFWAVTVIDCPEDIENVRLAVGSNSASMWWLNGEEVLLLSGDRRMVKDDAVSPRLTLKKGRNILRGAIINGPGMSDFCVRFVDEKGNPVKDYKIVNSEK